ncbi:MAG: hypothetical protein COW73_09605 [Nitrospirae bacterium CG18_big_fil_WC_8_21_14_2_50_70_55]|nr:hypothetical protein [Deltaproteobacteria bacterium]PIQ03957.1 MAG: hypothetical protein COW73_09605 [Nitrospirae bacterium CG18_big_fil_WC_8_21_14_2_50_70_55]PIW83837.1 MAG: hypothetical protein COZ96_01275 [Nitrospirae bacterium CG_4_8_14_3_um_filter_70_85]PIX82691.1 MAG: hypothetical protein COZ33_09315 [Nitrospirae bacterium CG_4_10_14_3_um_filter_70_108]PJB97423.1 MAG: hypothetical protein CO080_00135 [Nitrospirae bacterium CG_4_9_14_0_8_um_filter_70_14]HBB40799.1 hypothetical protein 
MSRVALFVVALLVGLPVALPAAAEDPAGSLPSVQPPASPAQDAERNPKVQDLGNGRFRVGLIEVDRNQRRFTVPAEVHQEEGTQEFVLCTKGGYKGYESVLEAGATAYEFNVACLLIGLDAKHARTPQYHFDPTGVTGDKVEVSLAWGKDKEHRQVTAAEAVKDLRSGKALNATSWVYTGSTFTPDGTYMAQTDGVLIGFVHDPAEIITLAAGTQQGDYGSLVPNTGVLPKKGTRVTVEVKAVAAAPVAPAAKAE